MQKRERDRSTNKKININFHNLTAKRRERVARKRQTSKGRMPMRSLAKINVNLETASLKNIIIAILRRNLRQIN